MADYYCDHGAYGLTTNRLGLDVPAWGVPQEGDGSTKDAATASSVASIDLTSITSTAGTFSLFGSAAISVGASASGATLATQIAAAINGSSITTGNTTIFPGAPQLRNAFFARATGATLEIMCRIGSALTNVLGMTWAGTWSAGPPSNLTFSGGSGGCWGWFVNPVAMGVSSSITLGDYGTFLHKPYAGGLPTAYDTIYVRTGGGASKVIQTTFTTSKVLVPSAGYSKNIVFDTNTQWVGDVASGALKLQITAANWNVTHAVRFSSPGISASYVALAFGGFEVEYICSQVQGSMTFQAQNGTSGTSEWHMKNVILRDSASAGANAVSAISGTNSVERRVWENCQWVVTTPRSWLIPIISVGGYSTSSDQRYLGCIFDFNISGVSDPGTVTSSAQIYDSSIVFQGCQFLGYAPGYGLWQIGAWAANATRLAITVDNCSGLALPTAYLGLPTSTMFVRQDVHQIVFSNAALSSQAGMRIEDTRGVTEWVPDDPTSFPKLASTLPGSGASYSVRVIWVRAVPMTRASSYESPDFRMFTQLASATRTLTLQVLMHSTIVTGIKASFAYIDSTGESRREDVETISSSAVTWTNAASYIGFVSRKFEVTTTYPVKANSEIVATVQLYASPPGSDATMAVYVDPEFTVT
jgi:hypothetical protein